jgi:hypothetical protein
LVLAMALNLMSPMSYSTNPSYKSRTIFMANAIEHTRTLLFDSRMIEQSPCHKSQMTMTLAQSYCARVFEQALRIFLLCN